MTTTNEQPTPDSPAQAAYKDAIRMLGGDRLAEYAVQDVVRHVIRGGSVHRKDLLEAVRIMLDDEAFMDGFND